MTAANVPAGGAASTTDSKPRVAAIVTAYYPRSHADVIVSKLLADYTHPAPRDLSKFDFHRQVRGLTEAPRRCGRPCSTIHLSRGSFSLSAIS